MGYFIEDRQMTDQVYTELCNAYESLTLVLFDMHRYSVEDGIKARDLIGKLIAERSDK